MKVVLEEVVAVMEIAEVAMESEVVMIIETKLMKHSLLAPMSYWQMTPKY